MTLVIDIPDHMYNDIKKCGYVYPEHAEGLASCIVGGTPLPKGHGRLIDADKCIKQAWNDFYKHEDEWEKKDPDYIGVKRLHDQNGFECCLKTIGESPTVIESEDKYGKV